MPSIESPSFAIHQQAVHALVTNPHLRQRQVTLKTLGEKAILQGKVHSYFEKQMAQESLKQIPGIQSIENHLEVLWQ